MIAPDSVIAPFGLIARRYMRRSIKAKVQLRSAAIDGAQIIYQAFYHRAATTL